MNQWYGPPGRLFLHHLWESFAIDDLIIWTFNDKFAVFNQQILYKLDVKGFYFVFDLLFNVKNNKFIFCAWHSND